MHHGNEVEGQRSMSRLRTRRTALVAPSPLPRFIPKASQNFLSQAISYEKSRQLRRIDFNSRRINSSMNETRLHQYICFSEEGGNV